jgi:hypothetical protein
MVKGLFGFFLLFGLFLQFLLIFYVAQEKLSVIRLTVRIMPKLTVIRINKIFNRTNTSSRQRCKTLSHPLRPSALLNGDRGKPLILNPVFPGVTVHFIPGHFVPAGPVTLSPVPLSLLIMWPGDQVTGTEWQGQSDWGISDRGQSLRRPLPGASDAYRPQRRWNLPSTEMFESDS